MTSCVASLGPTTVGNTMTFYGIGRGLDGNPEDVTGHTITFRAWDPEGNEIVKTTAGGGITLSPQSGSTLGQYAIAIAAADYPAAWVALPYGVPRKVYTAIERVVGADVSESGTPDWKIIGQGIL